MMRHWNRFDFCLKSWRKNKSAVGLYCTSVLEEVTDCNYYVVTVPTPVDKNNCLTWPLYKSSETVGELIKKEISWFTNPRYIRSDWRRVCLCWACLD
jgi:hypothetical protein